METTTTEQLPDTPLTPRLVQRRLRLIAAVALVACVGMFVFLQSLTQSKWLDIAISSAGKGTVTIADGGDSVLSKHTGEALLGFRAPGSAMQAVIEIQADGNWLERTPRWIVSDQEAAQAVHAQQRLSQALNAPRVQVLLAGGTVEMQPQERGWAGLGLICWLACALALGLFMVSSVFAMVRPDAANLLYVVMTWSQSANLLCIAVESLPGVGLPLGFIPLNATLRASFDLFTVAAIAHSTTLHPLRVPGMTRVAWLAWGLTGTLTALLFTHPPSHTWWWVQATLVVSGFLSLFVLHRAYRAVPHPLAMVLKKFGIMLWLGLTLLTGLLAVAQHWPSLATDRAIAVGSVAWSVFSGATLLMVPFLARSRQMVREFGLLAAISVGATTLDLIFVALFSLSPFTSLAFGLFFGLATYAWARQWITSHLLGHQIMTAERMFEHMYRIARQVEAEPQAVGELMGELLMQVFEPIELIIKRVPSTGCRVTDDGATLLVPIPRVNGNDDPSIPSESTVMLRFAGHGRRMFTRDDARLTERLVEQLRRATALDAAVERGRAEERLRIAQDLHDDIGARLLTLMYTAPNPEVENYVRHTLQDLKTLTRGLAAPSQRFQHALAEWKTDIAHRLQVADCDLRWTSHIDRELELSVVQWSALTRILRELVSNAIAHAHATHVDIDISLYRGDLHVRVSDNGKGKDPELWSHGLGLAGIRKRSKQLGGEVIWRVRPEGGITCEVTLPEFAAKSCTRKSDRSLATADSRRLR